MSDVSLTVENPTDLSTEDFSKAQEISKSINIEDTQSILQFGKSAQSKMGTFSESLVGNVRNKDVGPVGNTLTDLMFNLKDLKINELKSEKGNFFTNLFSTAARFVAKYEKTESTIDDIVTKLNSYKMDMYRGITQMDQMYKQNDLYRKEIEIFITAGNMKLEELKAKIPEMKTEAEASNDQGKIQKFRDYLQYINRLEKKIYDLNLSRTISIQASPQISMIRGSDEALVEKIESAICTTIPIWKQQVAMAISILATKKVAKGMKDVADTTNKILMENAQAVSEATIETARECERGIVEIETLQKTQEYLIDTITQCLSIQKEGTQKRIDGTAKLAEMNKELKTVLTQVNS